MANRKTVNSDFSYYFFGDRLALLYQNQSSGKLESWSEADVGDGLRIHYTAKYEAAKYFDNNFEPLTETRIQGDQQPSALAR